MSVCAFTSICEEDSCWTSQYLKEIDRLEMDFAIHFDRCSDKTKKRFLSHKRCIDHTSQDRDKEFEETDKQGVLDIIMDHDYTWALAWDIDETWEDAMTEKTEKLDKSIDLVVCKWANLWEDDETIRTDCNLVGWHAKFYNMKNKWRFDHPITNGAKMIGVPKDTEKIERADIYCLHHGMKTRELREMHKKRWDRIYTKAVGNNPYGFWRMALDRRYKPKLVKKSSLM